MSPSISMRNFVGGLLGGMAGILLSYYIDPLAIPFGVLFGVVLGWWHAEIINSVVDTYKQVRAIGGGLVHVSSFLARGQTEMFARAASKRSA